MAGGSDPRSWLDKAVGVCLSLLACALALYVTVRLVQAVAVALLVILGISALVAGVVAWLRARNRGW